MGVPEFSNDHFLCHATQPIEKSTELLLLRFAAWGGLKMCVGLKKQSRMLGMTQEWEFLLFMVGA